MKLLNIIGAFALASSAVFAAAQNETQTIVYGRTTVQFNAGFQQTLANLGATITDTNSAPLKNGSAIFTITEGAIDLKSAAGEVSHSGGYVVTIAGVSVKVLDLVLDTTTPTAPVITGLFVVNNAVLGRLPVFTVQIPSGFSLPLTPQNGVEQINGFGLLLAPGTANTFNTLFGAQVLQAGTSVGTANVYTVLAPSM